MQSYIQCMACVVTAAMTTCMPIGIGGMDIAGCLRRMLPTTCLGRIPHTRCSRRPRMTYAGHDDEARVWLPAWSGITIPILVRSSASLGGHSPSRPSVFSARGHTNAAKNCNYDFAISRHRATGITSRMLVVTKSLALVAFRRSLRPSSSTCPARPLQTVVVGQCLSA